MNQTEIGRNCIVEKAIIDEYVKVGDCVELGTIEEKENDTKPNIYNHGLVTIGEKSSIPEHVKIGKNSVVSGITDSNDYPNGILDSGRTLIKNNL